MLFDKNIAPSCCYCTYGARISTEEVICSKKGIVSSGAYCRKFKYDPLKREPSKPQILNSEDYNKENFEL